MKPLASNTLLQNRYLVVHLIGRGGMGEVYLAIDQRLGNPVALKRTVFFDDETLGGAFEREAKILARLRHNALPKVSDHFLEEGNQYLVMEYFAGDDLAKRLELSGKPFPLEWVMFWADKILDALDYLHSNEPPIIHRDIKPQNLKLTEDNQIVLLDFGLSKNTLDASRFSTSAAPSVVGYTPQYAPMEQIRGTGTSARSDIFSLSSTLYQLLTNRVPPDALTRADALLSDKSDPLAPPGELNSQIPRAVSGVILKGMEISQDKRFLNAREMQKLLRDAYAPEAKERNAAKISAANFPPSATTGRDVSLKTNVASTANVEARTPPSAAPPDFPISENYNSAAPSSYTNSASGSALNGDSQNNPFTTSIPKATEPEFFGNNNSSRDSAAFENKARGKSPLFFAGVAAFFLAVAALGFGFYISNRSNARTIAPETSVEKAAPTAVPTAEAAVKPADLNPKTEIESKETVSSDVSDADKSSSEAAESSGAPKSVQPLAGKTNPKPTQVSETKLTKPSVKPTAKTESKPTPLPRILP